jgi:hypothetical protein
MQGGQTQLAPAVPPGWDAEEVDEVIESVRVSVKCVTERNNALMDNLTPRRVVFRQVVETFAAGRVPRTPTVCLRRYDLPYSR